MIATALALVTAVWYFTTAREIGKNKWLWAVLGFISFQGISTIMAKIIVLPISLFAPATHDNSLLNTLVWIIVLVSAGVCAVFIREKYLKGKTVSRDPID